MRRDRASPPNTHRIHSWLDCYAECQELGQKTLGKKVLFYLSHSLQSQEQRIKGSVGEEEALYSCCVLWEKPVSGVEHKRSRVIKSTVSRRRCPLAWDRLDSLKYLNFASFFDLSEIIQVASCPPCKLEDASKDKCRQTYVFCLWPELAT